MNGLSVSHRLYLLVGLLAVVAIILTVVGLNSSDNAVERLKSVYETRAVPMGKLADIERLHNSNINDVMRGLQHDPKSEVVALHDHKVEEHIKRIESNLVEINRIWSEYPVSGLKPEEKQLAQEFETDYRRYIEVIMTPTLKALGSGDFSLAAISSFLKGNRTLAKDVEKSLRAMEHFHEREAKAQYEIAQAAHRQNVAISIAVALIGIGGALVFAAFTVRSITAPLLKMQTVITAVSQNGDFTRRIDARGQDEVGQTARAFDSLLASLRETFGGLHSDIGILDQAARELVGSAGKAANGSVQASEAASSMAASVEQLSDSVNYIAENARDVSSVSEQSGAMSVEGGQVIRAMTDEVRGVADTVRDGAATITELDEQSERISDIVKVIKDVADQTNLLALNAAIEAARAGEQGRGFAVVADEVRKLAERTTMATGEISAMIQAIQQGAGASVEAMNLAVNRVESGVEMARRAEESISSIRGESEKVTRAVGEITLALSEQSAAGNALARQVERIAEFAGENSASAAQAENAARHLEQLADHMLSAIRKFKVA